MASLGVNHSEQAEVWVDGQRKTATKASNGDWFVEINGKQVKVDREKCERFGIFYQSNPQNKDVTYWPEHFVDYYDNLIAENNDKIKYLKATGEFIQQQLKGAREQYANILAKFGVNKYKEINDTAQQAEARKFYNDISDLNRAKISNSNREYSAYMTAFDYALEKGDWQNQLNLAEHVQNSVFC